MSVVLSISSHVVRGTVGASLAGFVLQRIGHKVWTVPTVVWDHHPGFGRPSGLIPTGEQMASLLADLRAPEQAVRTDMILTGYFANEGQIEAVADHVRALRDAGHSMCFVCDPVCGALGLRFERQEEDRGHSLYI